MRHPGSGPRGNASRPNRATGGRGNSPVTEPRRRIWLPLGIAGGVALIALVAFVISLGPIDRLCRGMVAAAADLPESASASTCSASVTPERTERSFTAAITLDGAVAYIAAQGLPTDGAGVEGDSFAWSWQRPGERIEIGWRDGRLSYHQTLSDRLR